MNNYQYLAEAPRFLLSVSAGLTTGALLMFALIVGMGAVFDSKKNKHIGMTMLGTLCLAAATMYLDYLVWERPVCQEVTASLIETDSFTREERVSKHTAIVGYVKYKINDGSGLTYVQKLFGNSVVYPAITLCKIPMAPRHRFWPWDTVGGAN